METEVAYVLPLAGTYLVGVGVWVLVFMSRPKRSEQASLKWWLKVPVLPLLTLVAAVRVYVQ